MTLNGDDKRLDTSPLKLDPEKFKLAQFHRGVTSTEPEFCMLCSQKIAAQGVPDAVHEGFRFGASATWVCAPCFVELGPYFDWDEARPL